jgi:hypothetical protein
MKQEVQDEIFSSRSTHGELNRELEDSKMLIA